MTTDNKAVTCYLPEEIEQYVTQYCTEYSITRKDKNGETKPALATGIVQLLKELIALREGEISTLSSNLPSNALSEEQLKPLIEEAIKSHLPSTALSEEQIDSKLDEKLKGAIASLEEKFSKKSPA